MHFFKPQLTMFYCKFNRFFLCELIVILRVSFMILCIFECILSVALLSSDFGIVEKYVLCVVKNVFKKS